MNKELTAEEIIGLTYEQAVSLIGTNGLRSRVAKNDGEEFLLLADMSQDRWNLELVSGKVVAAYIG